MLGSSHRTQKHYDRWARENVFKEADFVMWKDHKTRIAMKLNKPWTDPWKVIIYIIQYVESNKVGLKRRIVHHNQLKRFHGTTCMITMTVIQLKAGTIMSLLLMDHEPWMNNEIQQAQDELKLNLWCWSLKEDLNDNAGHLTGSFRTKLTFEL
ncbi:Hypothetical predicted protein [Paramuricea clavata]|uniref:Uncharacterized protein n=1 Tax=Paramuricea clavata TaxID=317549 RepID=A0A6S7I5U5_PARCT|nr:Hypothetical predicted protein [Paramuricea clavata]